MNMLTIRDEFAMRALIGIRSRNPRVLDHSHPRGTKTLSSEEVARLAYEDADAMIAERSK